MKTMFIGALLCASVVHSASASIISDFSWVSTSPTFSSDTIFQDGTELTMSSIGMSFLFNGTTANFTNGRGDDPTITLTFSSSVSFMRLRVRDIDLSAGGERLANFSITPTTLSDDLVFSNGSEVASSTENGMGDILFSGIQTTTLSFDYIRPNGYGFGLQYLEFSADSTQVSSPAPISIMAVAIIGLASRSRRKGFHQPSRHNGPYLSMLDNKPHRKAL